MRPVHVTPSGGVSIVDDENQIVAVATSWDYAAQIVQALMEPNQAGLMRKQRAGMLAALDAFVQWHADHFEDFAPHDNAQLLCLANDASAAIALARNT